MAGWGATALLIAGFGAAGYATRGDLAALARVCFWVLLALIVAGIVLIFVHIPGGDLIYSVLGLVIFAWPGDLRRLHHVRLQRLRISKDVSTVLSCWPRRSSLTS